MTSQKVQKSLAEGQLELPSCGVIMPISGTENFSAEHWAEVQTLLHRAISAEGFTPHNVWEDTGTDRISERVIGNIFKFPVMVVDVSDLNPNVMFELGLRLASKKPTVVVQNEGGKRAFDISDFHALPYPGDLSILKMEKFLLTMSKTLRAKYEAAQQDDYVPFLGNLIVDVLSPTQRELPLSDMIINRLDRLEQSIAKQRSYSENYQQDASGKMFISTSVDGRNSYFVRIPQEQWANFTKIMDDFKPTIVRDLGSVDGYIVGQVMFAKGGQENSKRFTNNLETIVSSVDGLLGCSKTYIDLAEKLRQL
jgi:hypothetical protein